MPRWICSSCSTIMKVKSEHVGTLQRCRSCGVEEVVVDADRIPWSNSPMPPRAQARTPLPESTSSDLNSEELIDKSPSGESVTQAARNTMLVIGSFSTFFGVVLTVALMQSEIDAMGGVILLVSGIVSLIQTILVWPVYTMADDTRINRRLLEQIAKNLEKPTV